MGIVCVFSSFLIYRTYHLSNHYVHQVIEAQAELALQFDLSIRQYVAEKIRPVMYKLLGEDEFMPETMSTSFVARSIFEDVQRKFPDFILKFSSDNPRNLSNQAGPEELKIIEYFNNNPSQKTWYGNIKIDGKMYHAKFNARRMKEACLQCHGKPEDAPRSLLDRYGSIAGFHRPINEVIALDTIAIPSSKIHEQLLSEVKKNLTIIGFALLLLTFAIYTAVKKQISDRITFITKHLSDASSSKDFSKLPAIDIQNDDEIGVLAKSYNDLVNELGKYHNSLQEEITAKKIIESELLLSKNTLETVLNSSNPICITSLDFKVIRANKAYLDIWPDKSSGRETQICYVSRPGSFCHTELCLLRQIVGGKEVVETEIKKMTGGAERDFIVTARPFKNENGQLLGVVESFQDITELKQAVVEKNDLEGQLRHSQKMESIGTLAGGIAHDFNNILTAIIGYAELGKIDKPEGINQEKYFHEIRKAGDRAKDLVQHILTFSRKTEQAKAPVQVHLILREVIKLIRASAPTSIEIREDVETHCGYIFADPTQIHQVLMNLCTNAIHAMEENGGFLDIILKSVPFGQSEGDKISERPRGEYISIIVRDTGHGIPAEIKDKIFDPYYTTKEVGKGTGLGLSVVHGIVKSHNGEIYVESKVGLGSTFQILLPSADSEMADYDIIEATLPTGGESILLVDDEETVASVEKLMLENLGYQVTVRTSSVEAYEAFSVNPQKFDLVMTDQNMPNMTGVDLAMKLLLIKPDIPIILCTGFSEKFAETEVKHLGIKGFTMKPIYIGEIAELIRKVLSEP